MNIKEMVDRAHRNSKNKGWWDGVDDVQSTIPEKLCLVHSEVSEALEEHRNEQYETEVGEDGKPIGFATELADIVIRVADLCGAMGIDLEAEILRKMEYNETRSYRHGGKTC